MLTPLVKYQPISRVGILEGHSPGTMTQMLGWPPLTLFATSFLLAQAQHNEPSKGDTSQLGGIQYAASKCMHAAYSHREITEENLHKAAYHLLTDT
jgi:hypothetical protein